MIGFGMSTVFCEKNKVRILSELSENSISDKMENKQKNRIFFLSYKTSREKFVILNDNGVTNGRVAYYERISFVTLEKEGKFEKGIR